MPHRPALLILAVALLTAAEGDPVRGQDWSWGFLAGDGDRSGFIDRQEFAGLMLAAMPLMTEAGVERLRSRFDQDGDGLISPAEVDADPAHIAPDPQPPGLTLHRDIAYLGGPSVPDGLQMLDIHVPAGAVAAPVLVFIHGGGWAIGDKRRLDRKLLWWCGRGGIVVSVNYRLSPAVRHPAHIGDVAAAVAWVLDHIAEHGGDPQRVYVVGHSAGAHLAALVACDDRRLAAHGRKPGDLAGVICLDGAGYDLPRRMEDTGTGIMASMFEAAFTTDRVVQEDASPIHRLSGVLGAPPPFLIVHSTLRGEARRQAEALAGSLRSVGGRAEVRGFLKTHMAINQDLGDPGDPLTVAVEAFVAPVVPAP